MNNTLHKAIQGALDGGWSCFDTADDDGFHWHIKDYPFGGQELVVETSGMRCDYRLEQILFNVPFLKSLFNETEIRHYRDNGVIVVDLEVPKDTPESGTSILFATTPAWIYHGQQLIPLSNPERIDYVGRILEGK